MGQALYRKYRSKSLDEIVGQEHIITALKMALAKGRLSHAYLFTGPHGVGKTSVARILAHEINNLPYDDENTHIDIIEIDAASNRGIDEIRDLREKVYVAPTSGKFKVYIIDEVHMLTTQAFNALLKTLEEPPAHVVFILATTEAHKLPATIISRTQRYTFRPADPTRLVDLLKSIAKKEKLTVNDEALTLIAEHGNGSYRDSVGLLDQIGNTKTSIDVDDVHDLLGIPPAVSITALLEAIAANQFNDVVARLQDLYASGYQAATIAKELSRQLRQGLLEGKPPIAAAQTLSLLKELIDVPASRDSARLLELTLLGIMTPTETLAQAIEMPPVTPTPSVPVPKKTAKATISPVAPADQKPPVAPEAPVPAAVSPKASSKKRSGSVIDEAIWPQVINELKVTYNTLYSIVRMAQPAFAPDTITLTFAFAFHQKRLNEAKNKAILAGVIEKVCGRDVEVVCLFDKNMKQTAPVISGAATPPPTKGSIDTISNIFGGGELLES